MQKRVFDTDLRHPSIGLENPNQKLGFFGSGSNSRYFTTSSVETAHEVPRRIHTVIYLSCNACGSWQKVIFIRVRSRWLMYFPAA